MILRLWTAVVRFLPVKSAQGVPTDVHHFLQHAHTVAKITDLGAAIMRPLNGNLGRLETEPAGKKENFRIETPAFDFLQRKNSLGRGMRERLKTALGIGKAQPERKPQDCVIAASEEAPVKRLFGGLQFAAKPPRPDSD